MDVADDGNERSGSEEADAGDGEETFHEAGDLGEGCELSLDSVYCGARYR